MLGRLHRARCRLGYCAVPRGHLRDRRSGPVYVLLQPPHHALQRGHTVLAQRIGRPTATRAVGAANGRNPLPIVLPCHRVIGNDGTLTGFGGGLPTKAALLRLEGIGNDGARVGDLFG